MAKIDVVVATYNGEKFISYQLDSIISQIPKKTNDKWRILIHDDGSSDSTVEILKEYSQKFAYIDILTGPSQNGAKNNFAYLMRYSDADYIFFADQDDIWIEGKVDISLKIIKKQEQIFGADTPILVHSDLSIIDIEENEVSESMWEYQNLKSKNSDKFNRVITQNYVTGCAMLINRSLLKMSLPIPSEAIMHDWWIALIASAYGKTFQIYQPLVKYRQHGTNEVGAKNFNLKYIIQRLFSINDSIHEARRLFNQVEAFVNANSGSPNIYEAQKFLQLREMKLPKRAYIKLRHGFLKNGLIRNLAWLFI